jgi:hypothetical protein
VTPQAAARAPAGAGSNTTRVQPRSPILDDKEAADWIGRPGRQFPPNDESEESQPPAFPDDSKENETAPAAKLSPLERLRLKMADRRRGANSRNGHAAGSTQNEGSPNVAARSAGPSPTANGFAGQAKSTAAAGSTTTARGTRLVTLSPPRDSFAADEWRRPRPLPIDRQPSAATPRAVASAMTSTASAELPHTIENRRGSGQSGEQLPEWPEHQVARQSESTWQAFPAGIDRMPETGEPGFEPVRLVDPPVLTAPPIDGYESRTVSDRGLVIPRVQFCRQVRGFEDVVALDAQRLRQGQPVLIYATLEGFRSMATSKGYRTLTLSTLEIRDSDGELVQRQSLGPAVDLVDVPRRDFFLTHLLTIPGNLPVGNYIFELCVDDLLKHESARARIAVGVTEDRSPRDGTADTSKFATRPAGSRR